MRRAGSAGTRWRGERGQVLIIFVALFTVLLGLGAFAIDQGLFLNHRRVAQKDADMAARAGAAMFLRDLDDPSSQDADAKSAAIDMALANGAPTPDPDLITTATSCATTDPSGSSTPVAIGGAPSIDVGIKRPAPGLFLTAFGIDGDDDIGARSTACVGSVETVVSQRFLPLELRVDQSGSRSCFSGGTAQIGDQCVIQPNVAENSEDGLIHATRVGTAECYAGTDSLADDMRAAIRNGMDAMCTVATSGTTCGLGVTDCVWPADEDIVARPEWNDRLTSRPPDRCGNGSFADTFDYADGRGGTVDGPPGLGGSDAPGTVYVQKACSNPRVGLIPVADGSRRVRGVASVYIVGCFDRHDDRDDPPNNDCSGGGGGDEGDPDDDIQLRAVPIRLYMTDEIRGGIRGLDGYSPVTIQTTR